MTSAAAKHTIYIKRADLPTTFADFTVFSGEPVAKLRGKYASSEELDPKTIAFHKLTKDEANAVDKEIIPIDRRIGQEMRSFDEWTDDTIVVAYGEPLGKFPPRGCIKSGRPGDSEHCSPIPLALVHEVFASFSSSLAACSDDLDPRIYREAAELMAAMSGFYSQENVRTEAFLRILGRVLRRQVERTQNGPSIRATDGTLRVNNACVLTVEMKEANDPARQNEAYLIEVSGLVSDKGGNLLCPKHVLHAEPRLPAFLLDVYGGVILVVRGGYFAPPSLCTAILTTASMVADELHGPAHLHLARTLQVLASACNKLVRSYEAIVPVSDVESIPVVEPPALIRPIPVRCGGVIRCERQLMNGRLAFIARLDNNASSSASASSSSSSSSGATLGSSGAPEADVVTWPSKFVVKFARGSAYGFEAHKHVASLGFAPRILDSGSMMDGVNGWKWIAMEYLPEEEWKHYDRRSATEADAVAVQAAYKKAFKDAGLVHGDLRRGNVLIRKRSSSPSSSSSGESTGATATAASSSCKDVQFLDFDWAGLEGQAKYPFYLNPKAWEEEEGFKGDDLPDKHIRAEHDEEMLEKSEPREKRARVE
jgi:hypothetical protein